MSNTHVLVIAPNWIGDAVMSLPLLKKLHGDDVQIDVLATPWVAPIYEASEYVNRVIAVPFQHGRLQLGLRWQVSKTLRQTGYIACYILPNSWKSIIIPFLAGIPNKIGYDGESRHLFLTSSLPNPSKINRPSMVGHYLALADTTYQESFNGVPEEKFPKLQIKQLILEGSANLSNKFLPNLSAFFVFAPGAEFGPAKQWPSSHYSALANLLLAKFPHHGILILGSLKDATIADQIIYGLNPQQVSRIQNLCGKVPLNQAMGLVQLSKGLISNDSGMMHIGAALAIPQVAIFGSSDPTHTPPLSKYAQIMYLGLDCSPCHQRKCPLGHSNCLVQISPDSVFNQFLRVLTTKG